MENLFTGNDNNIREFATFFVNEQLPEIGIGEHGEAIQIICDLLTEAASMEDFYAAAYETLAADPEMFHMEHGEAISKFRNLYEVFVACNQ